MNGPDLFTAELRRLERENRALRQRNLDLELALANLLAAARGAWHIQARVAKRNAMNMMKRAA